MRLALLGDVTMDFFAQDFRRDGHEVYLAPGFGAWRQELLDPESGQDRRALPSPADRSDEAAGQDRCTPDRSESGRIPRGSNDHKGGLAMKKRLISLLLTLLMVVSLLPIGAAAAVSPADAAKGEALMENVKQFASRLTRPASDGNSAPAVDFLKIAALQKNYLQPQ